MTEFHDPHEWGNEPFILDCQDASFTLVCGCVIRLIAVSGAMKVDQTFHGAIP